MDPQVRNFLAVVNSTTQPPVNQIPIAELRQQFSGLTPIFHPPVDVATVNNLRTDSGIPLRVYHPMNAGGEPLPAIVYFHGGGWVMGNIETHDTLCRHLANAADAVIVSVDYRLAPEHPFPAAFDDAFEATQFVVEHAADMNVNPDQIGLAGDSAGGNLALAVALKARDEGGPALASQCLLYPVLDSRCETESYRQFAVAHGLTKEKMEFFWNAYLGVGDGSDPLSSPAHAGDLSGLPPTMVLTAEYDVLRDEGEEMVVRLRAAGVEVESMRCEGVIHGFIHFAGAIERGQAELVAVGQKLGDRLRRVSSKA